MSKHDFVRAAFADYWVHIETVFNRGDGMPHCDAWVLHKPGVCRFCDMEPKLQLVRQHLNMAYTGEEPGPGMRECPSTILRTIEDIERWPGNRAYPEETA